jgi:hypothetical protein
MVDVENKAIDDVTNQVTITFDGRRVVLASCIVLVSRGRDLV